MPTIALIGNPNTGKSTLFTALSGMHTRIANFPGCTVEKKVGTYTDAGVKFSLIDLPGTYSLSPRSLDEMVSVDVLLGRQADVGAIDAAVCIVDAANLERNLYQLTQVSEVGVPVVLCLNMWDSAQSRGITVDVAALSERLGVPVVTTSAHQGVGIAELKAAIHQALTSRPPHSHPEFPAAFGTEVDRLSQWIQEKNLQVLPRFLLERMLLDIGSESQQKLAQTVSPELLPYLDTARARLAEQGCKVPAIETKVRYQWIRDQLTDVVTRTESSGAVTASDRLDQWLTHRVVGLLVFVSIMFLVFTSIYVGAGPFMGLIEAGQGWLGDQVASVMAPSTLRSLVIDGIIGGVGSVLVFVPQIALLFLFISVLEDCGYMSRAAFLMDRLMTKLGLSGKSFVPLMSSFACAVPGVMATRVIENRQDRFITILIAPLMSCSARLPVYLLMIAAFVPDTNSGLTQGLVLFAMYSVGALVAIPVAWVLRKTVFRGETPPFVMELPSYKWPSPRIVLSRVYDRVQAFILRAGTLILCASIVVWAAAYFPESHRYEEVLQAKIETMEREGKTELAYTEPLLANNPPRSIESFRDELRVERGRLLEASFLGIAGHLIEPLVRPLGWDWRIGVSVIASFPAREVVLATMGTIFSLGSEVADEGQESRFAEALQDATWPDGRRLFTLPVACSIMVFFALCAQCAATLMIIRRETNSWVWPIVTFVYMTVLAYAAAWLVYQGGLWLSA